MLSALDALDALLSPSLATPRPHALISPPPSLPASTAQLIDSCVLSHPAAALVRRAAILQDTAAADGSAFAALASLRIYTATITWIRRHPSHPHPSRMAHAFIVLDRILRASSSSSSLLLSSSLLPVHHHNLPISHPVILIAHSVAATALPPHIAPTVARTASFAALVGKQVHITAWLDPSPTAHIHRGRLCLAVPRRTAHTEVRRRRWIRRGGRVLVLRDEDRILESSGDPSPTTTTTTTKEGKVIHALCHTPDAVVVVCRGSIGDHAAGLLAAAGITAVDHVPEASLGMIARMTHARILNRLLPPLRQEDDSFHSYAGGAESIDVQLTASQTRVFIAGDPSTGDVGVLLRAPTDTTLQLMEHTTRRIMRMARLANQGLTPGGGRAEVHLANMFRRWGEQDGVDGVASNILADVLLSLARTMLLNQGQDGDEVNRQLETWSSDSECTCQDRISIWDSVKIKHSALHIALDTAATLLRIDTIVRPIASSPNSTMDYDPSSMMKNSSNTSENWEYRRGQRRLRVGGSGWSEEEKDRWERKESRFYSNKRKEGIH